MEIVLIDGDGNKKSFRDLVALGDYLEPGKTNFNVDELAARGYCSSWLHTKEGSQLVIKTNPLSCPRIPGLDVPIQGVSVEKTPEGGTFYGVGGKVGSHIIGIGPRPWPYSAGGKVFSAEENQRANEYDDRLKQRDVIEAVSTLASNIGDEKKDHAKYTGQAEEMHKMADETGLQSLDLVGDQLHEIGKDEGLHGIRQTGMLKMVGEDIIPADVPACAKTEDLWNQGLLDSGEYVLAQLVNAGLINKNEAQKNLKKIESVLSIEDITCGS